VWAWAPRIGDRVPITAGLFAWRWAFAPGVTRQRVEVLLFMLDTQQQVKLSNAIEVV
jgi:hypothetical protein